ncbi:alpha-taxilin isoform X1 [Antennarius striatus]|uniref:alpha-taxilin isoform X1 n=1 Tax=Antennarius striatus TaxID=241820 RepID=UPI0035B144E2
MEMSLNAADVLAPPQPGVASSSLDGADGDAEAPPTDSSGFFDPLEEFSQRLDDIISTYGSAAGVLDGQRKMEAELEQLEEESQDDITVAVEADVSALMQSLNQTSSPQEQLDRLLRKYAEQAAGRRRDQKKLLLLQQQTSVLLEEVCGGGAARRHLEALCRELQGRYLTLREDTLRRHQEDEERRSQMSDHFQEKLAEIQSQIETHNARNDKLCGENSRLSAKLETLMQQCELREESLEKMNRRRDLQQQLTDARLQQADALLADAQEKHKREKEYLLREAIDKTKKCFAMKEAELAMKKKLTLYGQKFDEFQETLAKSNQIYAHFKKEMENMSEKMKKMDKESNIWKTRFENCNKALTDMIEERTEKGKEYDLFVLKIQKLEKLCRALQEERVVLYDKIKEVRRSNASAPPPEGGAQPNDITEGEDKSGLLEPSEAQEIQDQDLVLTEDMARLKKEQAKLQEFAAALLATGGGDEEEESHEVDHEDEVTSALAQFNSKPRVKQEVTSSPEQEVTLGSKQEVTSGPEQEVTSGPKQEVTSGSKQEVTSGPEQEVTSGPEQEVTSGPKQEVTSGPKQEVTSGPKQEVTSGPKKEVTSGPEQEVTSGPKQEVTSGPKQEVTFVPEQEVTSVPEQEVDVQPEEPVLLDKVEEVPKGSPEEVPAVSDPGDATGEEVKVQEEELKTQPEEVQTDPPAEVLIHKAAPEEGQVQSEPQGPSGAPPQLEQALPPRETPPSGSDAAKKQTPKKKKKRNVKNAS